MLASYLGSFPPNTSKLDWLHFSPDTTAVPTKYQESVQLHRSHDKIPCRLTLTAVRFKGQVHAAGEGLGKRLSPAHHTASAGG